MDVDEPLRRPEATPRVDPGGATPPRIVESGRRHEERPSLEGRLSLMPSDQTPRGRDKTNVYPEGVARRGSWDGERERYHDYPHSSRQDRGHPVDDLPVHIRLHPERRPFVTPQPTDTPPVDHTGSRSGKGSNRRARQRDESEPSHGGPQENGHAAGGDYYEPDRPGMRRGASLLDRLSLDTPSGSSLPPALRAEVSAKKAEEVAGLPPKPIAVDDMDGLGDGGSKGGRPKRKNGKSRRGRRSGLY